MSDKPTNIDEYMTRFPETIQHILQNVRKTIHEAAPDATESIGYGMPAFTYNGRYLVYFAAWNDHIGFYPTPSGTSEFKAELAPYESGKGSVKFPLNQPIPYDLIAKVVAFRLKESTAQ